MGGKRRGHGGPVRKVSTRRRRETVLVRVVRRMTPDGVVEERSAEGTNERQT